MIPDFYAKVYAIVNQIPPGRVATYGDIASALGDVALSRAVGNALHANPYDGVVPCHRVVDRNGSLAANFGFGGIEGHKNRLEKDGVKVLHDMVDLKKYRWKIGEDYDVGRWNRK